MFKIQKPFVLCAIALMFVSSLSGCEAPQKPKLKALIIDGENSHGVWPKTTVMMKSYLEETGLFEVDVARTTYTWQGPHYNKTLGVDDIKELLDLYPIESAKQHIAVDTPKPDENYSPNFEAYDVVISNFGWKASDWNEATKTNFEAYMKNGGGLVVVHAADNSWGTWKAFNTMTGIGGWGGRDENSGPYIYYDGTGSVKRDTTAGKGGSHGAQKEFVIDIREPEHPVMKGLPKSWMHAKDELYEKLRGPAENVTILATGLGREDNRHEPLLMAINYGQGRTFHTTLGHMDYSMECVGFITTLQRGAEWAATGKVTQSVPEDFPTENAISIRKFMK
ncbi:ThuA domain-containing protein [Flavivirga aquimarina]|uniref:ThuA domain-containing protein n=1 Tax=Flavivirga aquimarina TaxID=2027862 RepID=A0ABT8WFH8_9FLAO|nr:ThuA domain-containing protein [Flavivirga aquimarina]MDO5971827.1 ThuA domain-containing protein [Flavivirga aquimarina]